MWFHLVSINYLLNGAQRIFNYAKLGSITEMQGKQLPQCDSERSVERGESSANWPGGRICCGFSWGTSLAHLPNSIRLQTGTGAGIKTAQNMGQMLAGILACAKRKVEGVRVRVAATAPAARCLARAHYLLHLTVLQFSRRRCRRRGRRRCFLKENPARFGTSYDQL